MYLENNSNYTDEELHQEILLHLYLEGKARQAELFYLEQFVIGEIPNTIKCNSCGRKVSKKDPFKIFCCVNCEKKHAGIILWREKKCICLK